MRNITVDADAAVDCISSQ